MAGKSRVVALRKTFEGTNYRMHGYILTVVGTVFAASPLEAKQTIFDSASEKLADLPGIQELMVSQPRKSKSIGPLRARAKRVKVQSESPAPSSSTPQVDTESQNFTREIFDGLVEKFGTVSKLAKHAGVSHSSLTRYQQGEGHMRSKTIRALLHASLNGKHPTRHKVTSAEVEKALAVQGNDAVLKSELRVLQHLFGLGVSKKTTRETAHALNIQPDSVHVTRARALKKLGLAGRR